MPFYLRHRDEDFVPDSLRVVRGLIADLDMVDVVAVSLHRLDSLLQRLASHSHGTGDVFPRRALVSSRCDVIPLEDVEDGPQLGDRPEGEKRELGILGSLDQSKRYHVTTIPICKVPCPIHCRMDVATARAPPALRDGCVWGYRILPVSWAL